ncbi:MAG: hypothetical protein ACJLS2_02310 [Microcella pacifica]
MPGKHAGPTDPAKELMAVANETPFTVDEIVSFGKLATGLGVRSEPVRHRRRMFIDWPRFGAGFAAGVVTATLIGFAWYLAAGWLA